MGSSVLYMSISADGFVTGPNPRADNGMGDGGMRLHGWFLPDTENPDIEAGLAGLTGPNKVVFDELLSTGAVVAGRGTFEAAGGWNGDHHDGVQIYILSRNPAPDWAVKWPNVHYVDDLALAMREAKAAAGERNVMVHGASVLVPMALEAGLLDEMMLHQVPVLMGGGRRLFEGLSGGQRELERVRLLQAEGVTHLHYRVRK
jgi:dihydrofolate reductase